MGRFEAGPLVARVAKGAGALVLADLVIGMTAFSTISLGGLWIFSFGWIRLAAEYAQVGRPFGAPWQLALAWFGELACLPAMGIVLILGARALQVPLRLFRAVRPRRTLRASLHL